MEQRGDRPTVIFKRRHLSVGSFQQIYIERAVDKVSTATALCISISLHRICVMISRYTKQLKLYPPLVLCKPVENCSDDPAIFHYTVVLFHHFMRKARLLVTEQPPFTFHLYHLLLTF